MRHDLSRRIVATVPFLLLFGLVLSCGESREQDEPPETEITAEMIAAGEVLYEDWACAGCHGDTAEGNEDAPPLTGLAANWTVDTLAKYISDPQSFIERDARLQKMLEEYPGVQMPAYDVFPAEERRALAAYLLSR